MKRIVFICFCLLLAYSCKEKGQTAQGAETSIEWTRKTWNFGEVKEGEEVCHTFYFKNTGSNNLLIKNVKTNCGCTTVNYDKAPISPGKEGKIEIAFNSRGRNGKQYKEISIFANIPEKQTTISITADITH